MIAKDGERNGPLSTTRSDDDDDDDDDDDVSNSKKLPPYAPYLSKSSVSRKVDTITQTTCYLLLGCSCSVCFSTEYRPDISLTSSATDKYVPIPRSNGNVMQTN